MSVFFSTEFYTNWNSRRNFFIRFKRNANYFSHIVENDTTLLNNNIYKIVINIEYGNNVKCLIYTMKMRCIEVRFLLAKTRIQMKTKNNTDVEGCFTHTKKICLKTSKYIGQYGRNKLKLLSSKKSFSNFGTKIKQFYYFHRNPLLFSILLLNYIST